MVAQRWWRWVARGEESESSEDRLSDWFVRVEAGRESSAVSQIQRELLTIRAQIASRFHEDAPSPVDVNHEE